MRFSPFDQRNFNPADMSGASSESVREGAECTAAHPWWHPVSFLHVPDDFALGWLGSRLGP